MSSRDKYNVLFLGNGNSARSIMAEAILNREGRGKFQACSAGILTAPELDRHAVELLARMHFDTGGLRAKNWSELAGDDAPRFDFIFTVCDNATLLPHATWRGNPIFAHWGVADPAKVTGNEAQMRLAYADTFRMLSNRIGIFVNLPLRALDTLATQRQLDLIGGKGAGQSAFVAA
jgi:protein-tyrosine-phosphatase